MHCGRVFLSKGRGLTYAVAGVLLCIAALLSSVPVNAETERPRILVFYKTAGFVHASIPAAVAAIRELGDKYKFNVDATDDASAFTADNLPQYNALVFVSTTGDVLETPEQRAALESYIHHGGGYLGIHAAADMGASVRSTWSWYVKLVGGAFKGHTGARIWSDTAMASPSYAGPAAQAPADAEIIRSKNNATGTAVVSWEPARLIVEDKSSPAMGSFRNAPMRTDEWYGFLENPRAHVHVLASLDESSYAPAQGAMGGDHPIVWCQKFDGGRSVYTGLGHTTADWTDPAFLQHVLGAIRMADGAVPFNC